MMVLSLDNRGNGKSSKPDYPYSMEMFIDETNAFLEFLEIKEKIHLVGTSMGGMTAQNFVLKYPKKVKTLILISTSAFLGEDFEVMFEEYRKIRNELTPEVGFKRMLELSFSEPFLERLNKDELLNNALFEELFIKNTMSWQDYTNQAAAVRSHDTRELLNKIGIPTLILHGTSDKEISFNHAEFLHKKIPNSKLIPLEGLGHGGPLITEYERVNTLMWNFIQENLD